MKDLFQSPLWSELWFRILDLFPSRQCSSVPQQFSQGRPGGKWMRHWQCISYWGMYLQSTKLIVSWAASKEVQKVEGYVSPSTLLPWEHTCSALFSSGAPSTRRMQSCFGAGPQEAAKVLRALEHLCYGDMLRELSLFSLEKGELSGDRIVTFQYLEGANKKGGEGFFYEEM